MGNDEQSVSDPSDLRLRVEYSSPVDLLADYAANIRQGRTFILTERELVPGTRLFVEFSFPGLLEPIALSGLVIRKQEDETPGIEVAFDGLDAAALERLDEWIGRVEKSDPALIARTVRLLIVEDNPQVVRLLEDGIRWFAAREYGSRVQFEFLHVSNGVDALIAMAHQPIHLVITDIYMPVMDGASLIKAVRSDPKLAEIPIIAVSGGGADAGEIAGSAGATVFLQKPLRLLDVQQGLKQLIQI